ncbi:hypothetical protein ACWEOH_05690 [Agromyces sp. NPDC004153]
MAKIQSGLSIMAIAVAMVGLVGCTAPESDEASTTPAPSSTSNRNVTLDVGHIIHPDGTVEYPARNVNLEVGTILEAPQAH